MKKFIVLFGIVVIGFMTVLTRGETKNLQESYQERRRNKIELENVFERDETVNKLLEYLASVDKLNESDKDRTNHIYVCREGGIAEMNLFGIENNTYQEQIEKVERVLGLTGLTDFVYNEATIEKENMLLAGMKEEYGNVCHSKYYENAIVSVNACKEEAYEDNQSVQRNVNIYVPSEKLKDVQMAEFAEKLLEEGYYVNGFIQGEEKEVLVLSNTDAFATLGIYNYRENEAGEMEQVDLMNIRYEILMNQTKPEAAKVIVKSRGKISMNEKDQAVLVNAAQEMGLNEEEISRLNELVADTLEKPGKNQSKAVGKWQYHAKYTNEHDSYEGTMRYLEISLTQ